MSDILNDVLFDAFANASEHVYMYVLDMERDLSRWSKNSVEYFDMPGEYIESADRVWIEKVHPDDREAYMADLGAVLSGESKLHSCQYRAMNRYGDYVWIECKGSVLESKAGHKIFAGLMTRLDKQNIFDPLTGLKTKHQFYSLNLENKQGIIVLLAVDFFKHIINTYGYENGDDILIQLGKKFVELVGGFDYVYRFNGDEFIFYLPDAGIGDVSKLFNQINENAGEIVLKNGQKIELSFSAGAIEFPMEDNAKDAMINRLELSLFYIKREKRGCLGFYSDEIIEKAERLRQLKNDLENSIANDFKGFELYFQPWMSKDGSKIVGCEALLRWKGDVIKDSYPGEFIPILEETDDILSVGRFVMHEAMKQQKEWEEKYGEFVVSFNVSYSQFLEADYAKELKDTAKKYNVNPHNMVIELTESCNVQAPNLLADVFNELRGYGFKIALDDFGTGYASLEIFKQLPTDGIKIEHSFVRELSSDGHDIDFAIIRSLLLLCHELGQMVVVEGVENEEVDCIIRGMDAGLLQGYYYSRPVCKSEFEKLVEANR